MLLKHWTDCHPSVSYGRRNEYRLCPADKQCPFADAAPVYAQQKAFVKCLTRCSQMTVARMC